MSFAPTESLSRRHEAVRAAIEGQSLDAFIVTALPNVQYLTNFNGSAAIAVITRDRLAFITDSRYITTMTETQGTVHECPHLELVPVEGSYDRTLAGLLGGLAGARVGFEAAHVSVSRHLWWQNAIGGLATAPQLVGVEGLVERGRAQKDPYELDVLREAARRLSDLVPEIAGEARRGRTEREVAMAIDTRILGAGFEKTAFETIVAAGPNSAQPHARPSERKLDEGDLVVLDFGGVYASYCVDLTRTIVVGEATARARRVYDAVREAHDRAIETVRPGVSRFAIDAAAREALAAQGMAEAFGHGTGHGLGLEMHEDPKISKRQPDSDPRDEAVLAGMVFTIEPGAYFPGWGGVRIEDDVLVTEGGVEVLTRASTELLEQ